MDSYTKDNKVDDGGDDGLECDECGGGCDGVHGVNGDSRKKMLEREAARKALSTLQERIEDLKAILMWDNPSVVEDLDVAAKALARFFQ